METFSNIKSSLIFGPADSNNFFMAEHNRLLKNDDTDAVRDFYLLLMVYVNYFCIPVFPFVQKTLCEIGKSSQFIFSNRAGFISIVITLFVEGKESISKFFFPRKEKLELNFLSGSIYYKTVLS